MSEAITFFLQLTVIAILTLLWFVVRQQEDERAEQIERENIAASKRKGIRI
jgi:hypothetical protein